MSTKLEKLAVILTIATVLFSLAPANIKVASASGTGGKIDIYSQKEPYSGKGLNASSDAFGPGEEVQIYALVTYNDYPMKSIPVRFTVLGPPNSIENITDSKTMITNETGIANMSFTIPHISEIAFGEWTIIGIAQITEPVLTDTLKFEVGWIVEIVSIKTTDENYMERDEFTRGNDVGVELTVRNIAMTERTATLTVTIYDFLGIWVNSTQLDDFLCLPNETSYAHFFLYIPNSAHVGQATVYACAYTGPSIYEGVPYCPEVSKYFLITAKEYYLTVKTDPLGASVIPGEGWYEENANVSLTAPPSIMISAGVRYKFIYWDVDGVSKDLEANLIIILMDNDHTATAHYILQYYLTVISPYGTQSGGGWHNAGSIVFVSLNFGILDYGNSTRRVFTSWSDDASGNDYTQSNLIIMNSPKTAVANWKTQYYLTIRSEPLGITTVLGEGWYDEFANATIYAPAVSQYSFEYWDLDSVPADNGFNPITVYMDAPHTITVHYIQIIIYTLTITATDGGTTDPAPGTYYHMGGSAIQVSALSDTNHFFDHWELDGLRVNSANPCTIVMDQNHTLKAVFSLSPLTLFLRYWFYWILLPLSILILLLIVLLYHRRRRRKEESAYSGWTAWYYFHDI
jgi:hypothetical protein